MKPFFKNVVVLFLLFFTAQFTYGFSSQNGSVITVPADKHRAEIRDANDQALVIEHITLAAPELVTRSQQEPISTSSNSSPAISSRYALSKAVEDLNYLEYSSTICPALSGLVLIFPFHLFP